MIEIKGIKKVYKMGKQSLEVLKGVDLTIKEGEFVAIMGASGSGKSTLMHILGLLDKLSSGSYSIYGRDISRLNDFELAQLRARFIGFVFQQFNLLSKISAHDNVALPQIYLGEKKQNNLAQRFLKTVGLEDRMNHKPNELSGGERNRVHLAKVLKQGGNVLLLDEPTNDLDVNTLRMLEEAILEFSGCILVISHDRFFLNRICTHLLVFEGESKVHWFEGNYNDYEEWRKKEHGTALFENRRNRYRKLVKS